LPADLTQIVQKAAPAELFADARSRSGLTDDGPLPRLWKAPVSHPADSTRPLAALTVDVEDWYQSCVDFDAPISERVLRNMDRVLSLFDECRVKGTFFVQGLVAETFPKLLQSLVAEGHEVQSHGYSHRPLFSLDQKALRTELERARKTVEDACGMPVSAFRAQDFSLLRQNLWALDVRREIGFTVDSSIFPMRTHRYGISGWELAPHYLALGNGTAILEVPVAIWEVRGMRFPVAGGGYFRVLPQRLLVRGLRSIVASGRPPVIYLHPYEFNPEELVDFRTQVPLRVLLAQGLGRGSFTQRMKALLRGLSFGRFDEVLAAWGVT
jgi:polysaccharide deacetylase family protein (PEP-CTERM system associated)